MRAILLPALLRETVFYGPRIWKPWLKHLPEEDRDMQAKYLSAILPTTLHDAWQLSPLNWLDIRLKGTEAYYPHTLLSAYHWRDSNIVFDPGVWVFGDSGGFSIATLNANIDPADVIRWQLRNSTVGCILDFPPHNISATKEGWGGYAMANMEDALNTTVANTIRAREIYLKAREEGTSFRWWGVLQGETDAQLEYWWKKISDVYPFTDEDEGWAVKPFPSNSTEQIGRLLRFLKSKGIKRAHFLQSTGLPTVATLLALGPEADMEFITYDSSTVSLVGINRTVMIPEKEDTSIFHLAEKSRLGQTHARDHMLTGCNCYSCELMKGDLKVLGLDPHELVGKDLADFTEEIGTEYLKYRMIFHNFLITMKVFNANERLIKETGRERLEAVLGRKRMYKTLQAFDGRLAHSVPSSAPRSLLDWA